MGLSKVENSAQSFTPWFGRSLWRAAWAPRRDETAAVKKMDGNWGQHGIPGDGCKIRFQTRFAAFCKKTDARASMWPRRSHRTTVSCSWAAEGHGLGQPASQVGGRQGPGQGGATPATSHRSPQALSQPMAVPLPVFDHLVASRHGGVLCPQTRPRGMKAFPSSGPISVGPSQGKRFVQETKGTLIAVVPLLPLPPLASPFASPHPSLFWGAILRFFVILF